MRTIVIMLFLLCSGAAFGQMKPQLDQIKKADRPHRLEEIKPFRSWRAAVPENPGNPWLSPVQVVRPQALSRPVSKGSLQVTYDEKSGLPILISGKLALAANSKPDWQGRALEYLTQVEDLLQMEQAAAEFVIAGIETDELGQTHLRAQQMYKGVKVYGAELMLHGWDNTIQLLNGRHYPTPTLSKVTPNLSAEAAAQNALNHVSKRDHLVKLSPEALELIPSKQVETELVIYHLPQQLHSERLTWQVTLYPNVAKRWVYFVDAHSGAIVDHWHDGCTLHDHSAPAAPSELTPITATARDLLGVNRTVNSWQNGNEYFLVDASRPMFNAAQSQMPGKPVGGIMTFDMRNTPHDSEELAGYLIFTTNNVWNNTTAVSAHYNAGVAYEYFRRTFNRNSINGQGGNIISGINLADSDGGGYDNAIWNGKAMLYGNGRNAFRPLARALDVAGHEMGHGVIGSTAGLEYRNESGAMNESFADVFGAMIDRDDWRIGEDAARSDFFPSGALRNMQDPNNGGTKQGDRGWQPDHVNKQYRGTENNGGVHSNSGICNKAYYLFATAIGKDKAEQIYYRALTRYLTRSSQFVDLRIAVIQSATDLHGANAPEIQAAINAFNAVGILGPNGGGGGTPPPSDVQVNPGQSLILYADRNQSTLHLVTPQGNVLASPLTRVAPLSKPSITDDGTIALYVAQDNTLRGIVFDWTRGSYEELIISDQSIWRNVAISRDGSKLAALTNDFDNKIYISDTDGNAQEFELYNPTYTPGVSTGDVEYADVFEWDFTGEYLIYDAFNKIEGGFFDVEYWDIGFIQVWDNQANDFAEGFIGKLYSGLPENVSIGNPTLSKNSPYIMAFDYVDDFNEEYYVLGINIETGDQGIIFQNTEIGYPSYSVNDKQILFNATSTSENKVLAMVNLADSKIKAQTDPPSASILVSGGSNGARLGNWFANGKRNLTNTNDRALAQQQIDIFPNPFTETIHLQGAKAPEGEIAVEVFDPFGKRVFTQFFNVASENWQQSLSLPALPAGNYTIRINAANASISKKLVKIK